MKYQTVGTNIDYSGNCNAPVESDIELRMYVAEKIDIVNDFCVGRKKLKNKELRALQEELLSLGSMRAIDIYFRNFINSRI